MKIFLVLFSALFTFSAMAQEKMEINLATLQSFQINTTDLEDVEKQIGEPAHKSIDNNGEKWVYRNEGTHLRLHFDKAGQLQDYNYEAKQMGEMGSINYALLKDALNMNYNDLMEVLGKPHFISVSPQSQGLRYQAAGIDFYADFYPAREAARFSFRNSNGPSANIKESLVREIEEGVTTVDQIQSSFEGPDVISLSSDSESWKYYAENAQLELQFTSAGVVSDYRYRVQNN